jgi:26S proteasome regulatory subunit T3
LTAVDNIEVDDYLKFKKLEKQLEHLDVMEEYVKLDMRNLEKELLHAQEEVSFLWFIC